MKQKESKKQAQKPRNYERAADTLTRIALLVTAAQAALLFAQVFNLILRGS